MMRKWRRAISAMLTLSMLFSTLNVPAASFNEEIMEDEFLNDLSINEEVWDMDLAEEDSDLLLPDESDEQEISILDLEDSDSVTDAQDNTDPSSDTPAGEDSESQKDLLIEEPDESQLDETQQEDLPAAAAPDGEGDEEIVIPSGQELSAQTLTEDLVIDGNAIINENQTINLNGNKLTIKGTLFQQGGTLIIGGGILEVEGDYRLQRINSDGQYEDCNSTLVMQNEADYVTVSGSFYADGGCDYYPPDWSEDTDLSALSAGTLEVKGNLYQLDADCWHSFNATGTHKLLLSGQAGQKVFLRSNTNKINILETASGSKPIWDGIFNVHLLGSDIEIETVEEGIELINTYNYWEEKWEERLDLNGHDLTVHGNITGVTGIVVIGEDRTLTIDGNFLHDDDGILMVSGGSLKVTGDYRIGRLTSDGNYEDCDGCLVMVNEKDHVTVDGAFYPTGTSWFRDIEQGSTSTKPALTAGLLELKGDLFMPDFAIWDSFRTTGTHRILLAGGNGQKVTFHAGRPRINILETAEGCTPLWEGNCNITKLGNDLTLNTVEEGIYFNKDEDDLYLNGYDLTINGKVRGGNGEIHIGPGNTLKVDGTLVQDRTIMLVDGGTLDVTGDYRIQHEAEDGLYEGCSGVLVMTNDDDLVKVDGNFYFGGDDNYDSHTEEGNIINVMTAGVLEVKGDFIQAEDHYGYFHASGTHKVVLNGESKQYVDVLGSTWETGFATLEVTKDKDNYLFKRVPCWNSLKNSSGELDPTYISEFSHYLLDTENGKEAVVTDYLGQAEQVEIPETLQGLPVTTILREYGSVNNMTKLKDIKLPKSLKTIGERAFYSCKALTEVQIPEGVTAIDSQAFEDCIGLEQVTLPSTLETIGDGAFTNCQSLKAPQIPNGVTSIEAAVFMYCMNIDKITLPETIKSIGEYAFYSCTSLEELEIPFGVTTVGLQAFGNCPSLKRLVIPSTVTEMDWEYDTLKDVELYVVPGSYAEESAIQYGLTFRYLVNDVSSIGIQVTDALGNTISEGFTVNWSEENSGRQVGTGQRLQGVESGTSYVCEIFLGDELIRRYLQPEAFVITAEETDLTRDIVLQEIGQVKVSGLVKNSSGEIVPLAQLKFLQTFGVSVSDIVTDTAESDGSFSIMLPKTSTSLVISADGYYQDVQMLSMEKDEISLDIVLRPLPSNRISLSLLVQNAVEAEEIPSLLSIAHLTDLELDVFNETRNLEVEDYTFQDSFLYFDPSVSEPGDVIRILITDKTGQLAPGEISVTLDENRCADGEVTLIENGRIRLINISGTEDHNVMIFDSREGFVENKAVNASYLSRPLPEGTYTCVVMKKTGLLPKTDVYGRLAEYGLTENTDYAVRELSVQKGVITIADGIEVPEFDENRLSYTIDSQTMVWTSRNSVVTGEYADVRVKYEIDGKYKSSNEAVIIDLPEGVTFLPGSLTVNGKLSSCTVDGNRVTVPAHTAKAVVRFYALVNGSGKKTCYASLSFEESSDRILQPLGSCSFEASAASIKVPTKTSSTKVKVIGTAHTDCDIAVYDNGTLAGTTTVRKNGRWDLDIELTDPRSYSYHEIYAVVSSTDYNVNIETAAATLFYNSSYVGYPQVTMINRIHGIEEQRTIIDYQDPPKKAPSYYFDPSYPTITFILKYGNQNQEAIQDLYVVSSDSAGNKTYVKCTYDQYSDQWIAAHEYTPQDLPCKVAVSLSLSEEELPEVDMEPADLAKLAESTVNLDETIGVLMEDKVASGDAQVEENQISIPVTVNGQDLGTFSVEVLDYAQFHLSDWEGRGYMAFAYEDGSTSYQLSESTSSSYITYTVYPQDNLYVQETFTLYSADSGKRTMADVGRKLMTVPKIDPDLLGGLYDAFKDAQEFQQEIGEIVTGLREVKETLNDLLDIDTNYQILLNDLNRLKKKKDTCKCVDNSMYDGQIAELGKEVNEYRRRSRELLASAIGFRVVLALTKGRLLKVISGSIGKISKELYLLYKKKLSPLGPVTVTEWEERGLEAITEQLGKIPEGAIKDLQELLGWLDFAEKARNQMQSYFNSLRTRIRNLLRLIQLNKCTCEKTNGKCKCYDEEEEEEEIVPILDPSGYVYEAVPSNRVSGVKAEVYAYDYTYDEFGVRSDEKSEFLWDAENYDQVNPQYTDSVGQFGWDVPNGQYVVRFSKDGYEDADSHQDPNVDAEGYLPVPPIQTEVNTAIVSKAAPEVESVSASPNEVQIGFSQYVQPGTINDENVTVTCSGKAVVGTFVPLNAEADYECKNTYASIFAFQTTEQMKDTVTVAIRNVENYTGTPMAKAYEQSHKVLLKPESVAVNISGTVTHHGNSVLDIEVLPKEAGANRQLSIVSYMPSIIGVQTDTVTTDAEGKASVLISANLPGQGGLCVTVLDTGLSVEKTIDVAMSAEPLVTFDEASFKVNVASEKYVYDGTEHKPAVNVEGLTEGTDYAVFYENNVGAGTAKAIVQGLGRIVGTITKTFTIDKAANKLTASDITIKGSKSAQNVTIKAKAVGGTLSYKPDNNAVKADRTGKVTIPANFSGKIIVTVTAGDANYQTATKKVRITVSPTGTTLKSAKNTKGRKLVVKWAKNTSCTGYQIQYTTNKKFKSGVKTVMIKKNKITSKTFKKLKKGKTYYVRIRTYKTVAGGELYSDWSKVKKVKIKK